MSIESSMSEDDDPEKLLMDFRLTIDNLDRALISIMAERFRCTQKVGELKAKYDLPVSDPEREALQIRQLRKQANEASLDPDFAEAFLKFIIHEVIRNHRKVGQLYRHSKNGEDGVSAQEKR